VSKLSIIIYIETKEFVKNKKMQKLTNKEEEIMQILWKLKKAFVKK
jgi:predicted transcriptional regulator